MQGHAVPKLIGFGIIKGKGLAFMASELLGPALSEMSEIEIAGHAPAAEGALAALHSLGVLHGDAHPGNCLLRKNGMDSACSQSPVAFIDFSHSIATSSDSPAVLGSEAAALREALAQAKSLPERKREKRLSRQPMAMLSCRSYYEYAHQRCFQRRPSGSILSMM